MAKKPKNAAKRPAATEAQPVTRQRVKILGANLKIRWEWRERGF